ncbi:MAG: M23 family metallopeptidase [Patescibacteria group bacterium]
MINVGNSQTISLLTGYLNINPTGISGTELAIVDGVALESNGRENEFFIDLGKSGTGQISVYIVRKGDTLSEIADMFDVSVNTIIWANDIRGMSIKAGQELVILPISGVRHVVKSGDTLQSITKKYKAELEDVLVYNDLEVKSKLTVGNVVIIPDGVISIPRGVLAQSSQNQISTVSGYYLRPISGGVKSQGIHGYNGVDLAPYCRCQGDSVFASAAGTVLISRTSGYNGGYGLYVVIKHSNGTQTLYGHLSRVNVGVGQVVERGQVIGAIGNTGRSSGPHLHFEVRGAKNPF